MAQVPDRVLSWLYGVLHEYRDPQRTYSDSARTLSAHPTISPRTEVYTYEDGASALLLTLHGILPVPFRGTTYRYPIKLWIPHTYPQEAPIVYVDPGKEMIVRPGQHVAVDGRVFHPYLRDWTSMWDRASIAEFLGFLTQAFAKEPPVISRTHQQQFQRPLGFAQQQDSGAGPAPPQLPPKQRVGSHTMAEMPSTSTPPPRPPKPGEEYAVPQRDVSRYGPPLPPLPPSAVEHQQPNGHHPILHPTRSLPLTHPTQGYQNGRPPEQQPLPPVQQTPHQSNRNISPVSPISPVVTYSELPTSGYAHSAPMLQPHSHLHTHHTQQGGAYSHNPAGTPIQTFMRGQPQPYQPSSLPPQYQVMPQTAQPRKVPPPDLLSDPFDVALPGPATSGPPPPAPPIPPNPEKEHLMQAASATLVQQAQQRVNQTLSAIAPLEAQQQALRVADSQLEAEIRQLEQLDAALSSNEAILHRSIQECDQTIAMAKSKRQPPIDEVLIAPTMVANQLWTLCAEEAACREAMYMLQKAVDCGRVSGNDFVRQMRGLGRECFLKMALAKKCARGMGLDVN